MSVGGGGVGRGVLPVGQGWVVERVGLFTLGTLGFKGAVWVFTVFICVGVLFTGVGVFT